MTDSIYTRIPKIPSPPSCGIFASISAFTLLGLISKNKIPHHPALVALWACGSYCFNRLWRKLKARQLQADLEKLMDHLLKMEGACECCRRDIIQRGPGEFPRLMVDLMNARENLRAAREDSGGGTEGAAAAERAADETRDASGGPGEDEMDSEGTET